jgi:hypothetical protein
MANLRGNGRPIPHYYRVTRELWHHPVTFGPDAA